MAEIIKMGQRLLKRYFQLNMKGRGDVLDGTQRPSVICIFLISLLVRCSSLLQANWAKMTLRSAPVSLEIVVSDILVAERVD